MNALYAWCMISCHISQPRTQRKALGSVLEMRDIKQKNARMAEGVGCVLRQ